jgi:membrane protein implicated in regulation of membrane protease activity
MKSRFATTASVFARYLLFQLPGGVIIAALLALLVRADQLSPDLAYALFGAWVLVEIALFPVLRVGYEPGGKHTGVEAIVGSLGIAEDALDPEGSVRLGPERWRAVADGDCAPIAAGSEVRVRAVRQLTLVVEPAAAAAEPGSRAIKRLRDD